MRRVLDLYVGWLARAPLLTKCVTSGVLFGTGDRIAQRLERHAAEQEQEQGQEAKLTQLSGHESATRTLRMIVWGGCFFAPIAHNWYNLVDRTVKATGAMGVAQKIAMDQLLFAPFISTTFFTTMQCMQGKRPDEALEVALAKVPPTLEMNYRVWPFVHLVTFNFVPLQYRVLFINCISLGWSAFLSGMSNQDHSSSSQEVEDAQDEAEGQGQALVLMRKAIE